MSSPASAVRQSSFDVERPEAGAPIADVVNEIYRRTGMGHGAIFMSFAKLFFGHGRVSFHDFVQMRLFDPALREKADLAAFVGGRRGVDICVAINYEHGLFGVTTDKVLGLSYLAFYGLPIIGIEAAYAPGLPSGGAPILRDRDALKKFLARADLYPLFGKPTEGYQSLGTIGLRALAPDGGGIETTDGVRLSIDQFVEDIATHYQAGYLFQPMVRPHQKIAALCGERLACVRLMTALTENGPQILRGCWKIPAGGNVADNYWRHGNLLATLDLANGRVLRAVSGGGFELVEHETHPNTGAPLIGFEHPAWSEMVALALDGARLMRHVPLIGWDIACTEQGPTIVEMNHTPDFILLQLADRRGMYDEDFKKFELFHKKDKAARLKELKALIARQ